VSKLNQVFQQGQSDCGVACLLTIIQYYKGDDTLENLRRISGTTTTGTTLLGLWQAARQLGFDAAGCECDIIELINQASPVILHVIIEGKLQHYVVCFGKLQSGPELKFIIGDPAKGIVYLKITELKKIWQSGICLMLTPNTNFKKACDVEAQKIRWFKDFLKEDFMILWLAAAIGICIAVLSITMNVFTQKLIDDILPNKMLVKLNIGIILLFLLLLIKEGLSALRQYFLMIQSKSFSNRIISHFYQHLLRLPKPFFDTRKIGELVARLNDTSRIQRVIIQIAGNSMIDVLGIISGIIFLFIYSSKVGICATLSLPIYFLLIYKHNKRIIDGQRSIMQDYAINESNYISTIQGVGEIKGYNKQELFGKINTSVYGKFQNTVFLLGKIQIRLGFWANSFGILFLLAILSYNSYQVIDGGLKIGELIAILGICSLLLPAAANLALLSIPLNEAKIAFDRMFEFTNINSEHSDYEEDVIEYINSVELKNISFRFAGRNLLLRDVSLSIAKREIVGLLGENGSGKSTIVELLQKNYPYEDGSIFINKDKRLSELSIVNWRKYVATVSQHIHIFNSTVIENIAFEDASLKPAEVLYFLKEYGFLHFFELLPRSVMTLVGEEGINLSGGQKQMIALARALYHRPQFLILDEATSAMDRLSEYFVLDLLTSLKSEMAILFITHRIHVLKNICDRIYILENGGISTYGDHNSLLGGSNLYSKYWSELVG